MPTRAKLVVAVVVVIACWLTFKGGRGYSDQRVDPLPWAPAPQAEIRPTLPVLDGAEAKALAAQFQPSVHMDHDDGFPPVSVEAPFLLEDPSGRQGACLSRVGLGFGKLGDGCTILHRVSELAGHEVQDKDWALDFAPAGLSQLKKAILSGSGLLGDLVPGAQAPMYFHAVPGPHGTVGLQYWFFYPFNYQPVVESLWQGDSGLVQMPWDRLGQHEGDFESITVLLSDKLRPVYVWMARHDTEGQRFAWEEGVLDRPTPRDSHLDVYAARGSHATYEFCSRKARQEKVPLPDDVCRPELKITPLRAGEAPLIDLARTSWACWKGRFGWSPARGRAGEIFDADGPFMPLWQQGKFGDGATPCDEVRPLARRGREAAEMPDGARARALRARSGRVNGVFARCADWNQAIRAGAYVVACSDTEMTRFVRSGLSISDGPCVRFVIGRDDDCRSPRVVPAVYHASNPVQLKELGLTADATTTVDVFAGTRGTGREELVAFFEDVAVGPGRRLRVEYAEDGWRILEGDRVVAKPVESQAFATHRPPGDPRGVEAVSGDGVIDVTFSTEGNTERVRYTVAAAWTRDGLSDDPLVMSTVRAGEGGRARRTVSLPFVPATWVRVSAHRDGMSTWTDARIRTADQPRR